jgi:hypothetical protein
VSAYGALVDQQDTVSLQLGGRREAREAATYDYYIVAAL